MPVNVVMVVMAAASGDGLREGEFDVDGFLIVVDEDQVDADGDDVADARIVIGDLEGFDLAVRAVQPHEHRSVRLIGLRIRG
jgi:hypothetical protein